VLDTLAEIQERNRAVKDLEASLLELHQVFLDMAVLVEAQGEMLDNIEKQVGVQQWSSNQRLTRGSGTSRVRNCSSSSSSINRCNSRGQRTMGPGWA
jgi:hypothetical protein